jgi:outer membrane protein
LSMSNADLQPKLDLILSAYSAGLHGQGNFNRAYQKAWTDSEPGYSVGLNFEYPLGNRRAVAGRERSEAQLRRLQNQFQVIVSDVALNIRDRIIAVEKASSVLLQSAEALSIASQDLDHLQTRRDLLADGSQIADLYLDALLRSQDRLSTSELRVLRSQVDLDAAMVNLQHARGMLRKRLPAS